MMCNKMNGGEGFPVGVREIREQQEEEDGLLEVCAYGMVTKFMKQLSPNCQFQGCKLATIGQKKNVMIFGSITLYQSLFTKAMYSFVH